MTSELGWKGVKVRHEDGRSGVIQSEYIGFMHAVLGIRCSDGTETTVQLNTNGPDTGERGWEWLSNRHQDEANWWPLGDHQNER